MSGRPRAPEPSPGALREAIAGLLKAMRWWAAQEDGIPDEAWGAYMNGCAMLGWAIDGAIHTPPAPAASGPAEREPDGWFCASCNEGNGIGNRECFHCGKARAESRCSFCGRLRTASCPMFAGASAVVCTMCVTEMAEVVAARTRSPSTRPAEPDARERENVALRAALHRVAYMAATCTSRVELEDIANFARTVLSVGGAEPREPDFVIETERLNTGDLSRRVGNTATWLYPPGSVGYQQWLHNTNGGRATFTPLYVDPPRQAESRPLEDEREVENG